MTPQTGPWSLIRDLWTRNFRIRPVGTVLGSLLAVGALGLVLFFGFFIFLALLVMGGLFLLASTLLGGPRSTTVWHHDSTRVSSNRETGKSSKNSALEGEFSVVSEEATTRTRQR